MTFIVILCFFLDSWTKLHSWLDMLELNFWWIFSKQLETQLILFDCLRVAFLWQGERLGVILHPKDDKWSWWFVHIYVELLETQAPVLLILCVHWPDRCFESKYFLVARMCMLVYSCHVIVVFILYFCLMLVIMDFLYG